MLRSSYRADEVSFLLTDLSGHALELGLGERERAIQGGRNYAEMLPVEYAPSEEYLALFEALLDQFAAEVAGHVGVVTEMALAARGGQPVLVSLARAGTPVGILMRRWAQFSRDLALPHYSVSIVRGRGIDTVALDHIVARHDPRDVLFVDGWTGKGAIAAELSEALACYAAFRQAEAVRRARRDRRSWPLRRAVRHQAGSARAVGVPELDGVRAGQQDRAERPDQAGNVPRREGLLRAGRRGSLCAVPGRRGRAVPAGRRRCG